MRIRKVVKTDYSLHPVCSTCLSVSPHETTPLTLDSFPRNFISEYFSKVYREGQVPLKSDRSIGCFTTTNIHFLTHLAPFFLEWEMFQTKLLRQNPNFTFNFFFNSCLYKIMWKIIEESGGPQMTIWRIGRWITKATDTHSEIVVLTAFPCNSGCTNAPLCYAIRTLPLLLIFREDKNILLVQPTAWSLYWQSHPGPHIKRVFFNFAAILSRSRKNFTDLLNTESHYLGKSIKSSIIFVITCTDIVAMSAR